MKDRRAFGKIAEDISILYELSLAIGQSLDLTANCDRFLKTLMARKNLGYASVWIRSEHLAGLEGFDIEGGRNHAVLVYANPRFRVEETRLPLHHALFSVLKGRDVFSIASEEPRFQDFVTEKKISKGAFAIFAMGSLGVLKLYSMTREAAFDEWELNQLRHVVAKFTLSVQACLSHQKAMAEVAARKEAEALARENEDKYRTILESIESAYLEVDLAGNFLFFNESLCRILGYSRNELMGSNYSEFVDQDNAEKIRGCFENIHENGAPVIGVDWEFIRKDGTKRDLEASVLPITDVQGSMTGFRGIGQDVTESKRAAKKLRKRTHELGERVKELKCLYGISHLMEHPDIALEEIFQGTVDLIPPSWQHSEIACARIVVNGRECNSANFKKTAWFQTADISVQKEPIGYVQVCYLEERPERDEGPFFQEERHLINVIAERLGTIVEQRRVDEAFRNSEERIRAIVNTAVDGIITAEANGIIWSFNPAAEKLFGYSEKEVLGRNLAVLMPSIHKDNHDANMFNDLQTGKQNIIGKGREAQARRKEGTLFPIELTVSEMHLGETHMFTVIVRDITERKLAAEALQESQERLITAIEALDDGFVLYDATDRLALCNSRYLEIYKASAEFIKPGERFEDIIRQGVQRGQYAAAVGREEAWIAERLKQHRSSESTIEQRLADGTWLRIAERQTRDGGVVGFRVDITDLKKVEAQLRKANETLEERVWERTREIEQMHGRMVLQEKMASVGQLAAGIAHELNNPINFVRTNFTALTENFTDLKAMFKDYRKLVSEYETRYGLLADLTAVREKEANLQIDYILNDIPSLFQESARGFERIARIIQSMRDFSHVNHTGNRSFFNLNKGIEDTLVIARNVYKYHSEIRTDLGDLPEIACLPEQLNQVFLNLIVNSAQAIETAQRTAKGIITIRTWSVKDHVCCEIADNGPGITNAIRSRIYEPFFTTKEPGQGTGLGLSISYDIIVNKHGGELSVDCPATGGTVFTLRIPVDLQPGEEKDENRP